MGNTIARSTALAALVACCAATSAAQRTAATRRTENVILVVVDGVRWQEVFGGADSLLLFENPKILGDDSAEVRRAFWDPDVAQRRKLLFPFLWNVVGGRGQLVGSENNRVLVRNGLNFSYPGYNEMLTGFPDPRIDSNDHGPNENVTVFEWISRQSGFAGRVAAFGTWGVFADIFNRQRSGLYVRAGWEPPYSSPRSALDSLQNRLYATTFRQWRDNAYDSFTHEVAMRYLREHRPRLLFVGYGETDEWAHDGRYDRYLRAGRQVDAYLEELWRTVQSIPAYRGKTTLIVTTDHGRGRTSDWTSHGKDVSGAERAWIAVIGPDTPNLGERNASSASSVTQSQIAATVAALLGLDYRRAVPNADPPIDGYFARR